MWVFLLFVVQFQPLSLKGKKSQEEESGEAVHALHSSDSVCCVRNGVNKWLLSGWKCWKRKC